MSKNQYSSLPIASSFLSTSENFTFLSKLRIIQKNLVHVQGFPDSFADKNLLSQPEYFGQFGKIQKIVVVSKEDEISKKKTNSAYITFSSKEEAAYAILSIDSIFLEGQIVRAFFGTSKYCIHFLNNVECFNKEKCMFLHSLAKETDILGSTSKFGYAEHIKLAKEIINYNSQKTRNDIENYVIPYKTVLPNIKTIYSREKLNDNSIKYKKNLQKIKNINYFNKSDIYSNYNVRNYKFGDNVNKESCIDKNIEQYNGNNIFKYKNHSRFFNIVDHREIAEKGKHDYIKEIDDIPIELLNLIDQLFIRMPFFKQFDRYFSLQSSELIYCQSKFNGVKDSWFDFIISNTPIEHNA